jgi:LCP family protein required for cell wall assembly
MSYPPTPPAATAPRCPACGAAVIPGDRFCADCGAAVVRQPESTAMMPSQRRRPGGATGRPTTGGAATPPLTQPHAPVSDPRPDPYGSRTGRTRRRWARKHPFLTILLALLVAGSASAAVVTSRTADVVGTLQAQTTPPPSLQLAVVPNATGTAQVVNVTVDTRPARTAVADAGLDYRDPGSDLTGVVSGIGAVSGVSGDAELVTDRPFTLLIVGVDAPDDAPIDAGSRASDVALARIDPATGSCQLVGLPPDARVDLPGYGAGRLDTALAIGGLPYQQLVLSRFTGATIDRYLLVDLDGIGELVDLLGPIVIEVDVAFQGQDGWYGPGPVTMGGAQAIAYIAADDDPVGRLDRQQHVLGAVLGQLDSADIGSALFDLLPLLADTMRTNLTLPELVDLAGAYDEACSSDDTAMISLEGTPGSGIDSALGAGVEMTVIDQAELDSVLAPWSR